MPPKKKNILKKIFLLSSACGCDCGRSKISSVHKPMPKPRNASIHEHSSSTMTSMENEEKATLQSYSDRFAQHISSSESSSDGCKASISPRVLSPLPKINESVAVVKDSVYPYKDFRASMKQMIDEREIYTEEELKELLRCFLEINSSEQQNVIVRAFVDICSHRVPHPEC